MSIDNAARSKDNFIHQSSDIVRENILNAALRCYQKKTIEKVRLVDIASEAKLARTTVYRYFDNKQEVLIGTIVRRLQALLADIGKRLAEVDSFAEFTVETIAIIFDEVPRTPLFEIMPKDLSFALVSADGCTTSIFSALSAHFRSRFDAACATGTLRSDIEFDELINWIMRVMLSYVMTSPRAGAIDFRKMLWQFLIPPLSR